MTTNELELHNIKKITLDDERVRILFNGIPVSLAVTVILDLILTLSHWSIIGHGDLIVWNILMLLAVTLRSITWFVWRNDYYDLEPKKWVTLFRAGAWIAGAVWGSAALFMFASFNPTYQALLTFTLAGIASASTLTLAIDKPSATGFVMFVVFPLSLRLHLEHGPIATPMTLMTFMYVFFVLTASTRARRNLEDHYRKNERLIDWGTERIQKQKLTKALTNAQSIFITDDDPKKAFTKLLEDTLELTESRFGFIGEVMYRDPQTPYITMHAITDISWDAASKERFKKHHLGELIFSDLNSLYGVALTTGKPIIANTPNKDMRGGGLPPGHPPLTAFVGIPIFKGTTQIAMLGLANKPNGYDDEFVNFLQPLQQLISQFITAMHHAQQHREDQRKIKRQAIHTQVILNEAFDAIITTTQSGIITSFNHAAEITFGYRAELVIGENIHRFFAEPFRTDYDNYLKETGKTGLAQMLTSDKEVVGMRRNGKEFPISLAASEITEDGEKIYIAVARDISERKHNEQIKDRFIATVSHELRTPLTVISASLAIITSGSVGTVPEPFAKLIKLAHNNSIRLQRLVSDLLDMDHLLNNQVVLSMREHNAHEILEKALNDSQYFAEKYHVKFRISSIDMHARILADDQRVLQVLGHLMSNAAKFSHAHSTVDLALTHDKNMAKFSVTDYGEGVPAEFKPNIFKSFSQADTSDTRKKDGSGIGLAISKKLVEKMGGTMGYSTNPGEGSCFFFELPLTTREINA